MNRPDLTALASTFKRFANQECRSSSTLYEHLSLSIAEDDALLALAVCAPEGQPVPNLLFAAVHFLLLQEPSNALAQFYPSLTETVPRLDLAYPAFRKFCLDNSPAIRHLLATRRVQTNEVRRSAYLFLAFSLVAALAEGRPLALIEIGASAGLNLNWDHYSYRYGQYGQFGASHSLVQVECALRGDREPPFPGSSPDVVYKLGLDLNTVDVRNDGEALWLRALIWPEHRERATLLSHAIQIAKQHPPRLVAGDGIERLPSALQAAPRTAAVCVFHTHTLNQFSPGARNQLSDLLAKQATHREWLYRVSTEWLTPPHPKMELTAWHMGQADYRLLAYCGSHGDWIEWLDRRSALDLDTPCLNRRLENEEKP